MITCTEGTLIDANLEIVEPGDPGWNSARRAFDLAVDQRPAAVAVPADERGVVAAVGEARRRGLRVVPQCGGHGASRLGPLGDALLLRTSSLAGVEIDARAHRARIKAGARWADLAGPASFLGLAPAGGFANEASIVGTVLGDGMGWLARRHGLAASSVTAVEYVTAEGELERSDAHVLGALRGGHVITALELELHPAEDLYAGALFFSFDRAAEVLHAWREWTETAPREITSVGRLIQFPDELDVAELVRGRSYVLIEAAHLGTEAEGTELLRPLRELRPELDTFTIVPPSALGHLHMAPERPVAMLADDGLVGALPAGAIDDLLAATGSESPLATVELRHASGALETLEHGFFTHAAGMPTDTASAAAIEAQLALVAAALAPYGAFPAHLS